MPNKKWDRKSVDQIAFARSKRCKKTEGLKPRTSSASHPETTRDSDSEADSEDSAYKPSKEELTRKILDYFSPVRPESRDLQQKITDQIEVESSPQISEVKSEETNTDTEYEGGISVRIICNDEVLPVLRLKKRWQHSRKITDQIEEESSPQISEVKSEETNTDTEYEGGISVRIICNDEVLPVLRLKKRWQHSRKSRLHGKQCLNETTMAGTRSRGKNGGMRPVVHVRSQRQINRDWNMRRILSNRQKTREKQRNKQEQSLEAQRILETALKKSSLSARVKHVYDVQRHERMVC